MLNEKKFRTIYEDCLSSRLTVREYCSNIGMCEAKFYYWKKKLKDQLQDQRITNQGFVPVVFDQEQTKQQQQVKSCQSESAALSCEVNYPNGISIKLNGQADIEVLQQLLQLNMPGNA